MEQQIRLAIRTSRPRCRVGKFLLKITTLWGSRNDPFEYLQHWHEWVFCVVTSSRNKQYDLLVFECILSNFCKQIIYFFNIFFAINLKNPIKIRLACSEESKIVAFKKGYMVLASITYINCIKSFVISSTHSFVVTSQVCVDDDISIVKRNSLLKVIINKVLTSLNFDHVH